MLLKVFDPPLLIHFDSLPPIRPFAERMYLLEAVLLAISLMKTSITQVTSTGTPEFVRAGNDLNLEVEQSFKGKNDFRWKFNGTTNIVKVSAGETKYYSTFLGRAKISAQSYSLRVKNVQENESGTYEMTADRDPYDIVVKFTVIVLNPVSPVELDFVDHNVSDYCKFTVSCRTQQSHVNSTFKCQNHGCSQEGGERSEVKASSLKLYLVQTTVFCNHSNQVSHKFQKSELKCKHPGWNWKVVVGVVVAAIVVVFWIFILSVYLLKKRNDKRKKIRGTENNDNPDFLQDQQSIDPLHPSQPGDTSPNSPSPNSTYCLVGPHPGAVASAESRSCAPLESLYAQVEKPTRS